MAGSSPVVAQCRALVLDSVRRPGTWVGAAGLAALLAVIPRLTNPAAGVRDNAALALELSLSTLVLVGSLVAALAVVGWMQRDRGTGLTIEVLSAPVTPDSVLLARLAGGVLMGVVVTAVAAAAGAVGWVGVPVSPPSHTTDAVALVLVCIPASFVVGAALGAVTGASLPRELAVTIVVVLFVGARVAGGAGRDASPAWSAWLPSPGRLDVARDVAFGRLVGWPSLVALALSQLALAAGAVLLASAALRRRHRALSV